METKIQDTQVEALDDIRKELRIFGESHVNSMNEGFTYLIKEIRSSTYLIFIGILIGVAILKFT